VQLRVRQPRVAHRRDVDTDVEQRVPDPVDARTQDALELTIAEQQAALVLTNLETTQHHQWAPPLKTAAGDGATAATPGAWSATPRPCRLRLRLAACGVARKGATPDRRSRGAFGQGRHPRASGRRRTLPAAARHERLRPAGGHAVRPRKPDVI